MSFGAIAEDYDRLRPGPPEEAVDWLLPEHCQVAMDLAAGTGLLTRMLARKAAQVVAVEPDDRMAAVLRARSPGVLVMQGRGEAILMADASADGVFVSSAWHWMDSSRAAGEIGRVLRDGGRFGIIWAGRDPEVDWVREAGRQVLAATARPDDNGQADDEGAPRTRRREVRLPDPGPYGNVGTASFRFTRAMTISDLVDMLATYSGVITANPQDRAAGLAGARAVLEQRFPGAATIDVPMRAWCWRADRANRAPSAEVAQPGPDRGPGRAR
jgi:SAM-dependent methyltransferase